MMARQRSEFVQFAQQAFQFLERDFGFECVRSEARLLRYESKNVFVNIFHSKFDELGLAIGLKSKRPDTGFDVSHLLAVTAPDKHRFFSHFMSNEPKNTGWTDGVR